MKKLLNIALVSVLFYVNIGYIIAYFVTLQHIKYQQFNRIKTTQNFDECFKIILDAHTQNEIHYEFWNKQEFEYKGKMYDIVAETNKDGKRVIIALADNQETGFIENFIAFMKNKMDGKANLIHFFKLIAQIEPINLNGIFSLSTIEIQSAKLLNHIFFIIKPCYLEVLKPPPNFIADYK